MDVLIKMLAGARELLATVVNEDKRRWGFVGYIIYNVLFSYILS